MIEHRYWVCRMKGRPNVYEHDTRPRTVTEMVSTTGGVRRPIHCTDDPEYNIDRSLADITCKQYHRAKYRVLQKQKGKR